MDRLRERIKCIASESKCSYIDNVGARQHIADAEVKIRILKEQLRYRLTFNVCKKLSVHMVYGATIAINVMPRTDQDTSSREKFMGVKLDDKMI